MNAGPANNLEIFQIFLRKTLKFFATLPLPILDEQERVPKAVRKATSVRGFGWSKKILKFFAGNPKVLLSRVVTLFRCGDFAAPKQQFDEDFSF